MDRTLRIAALLGLWALASGARAQTSGDNGSHDPSRMIESEGKVYVYSTGGGATSSSDGLVWKSVASPPWNTSLLPNNQGIWAPDGLYLNSKYYLYGAMWAADKSSAIILLTTPSLNPSSPNYKWSDKGVAISGPKGVTHSVIDPCPIVDQSGNLWVVFGGGYPFATTANSIILTRMDNNTGLALTTDPGYKSADLPGYALEQGHKEGPYIYYHGGYYFLWWQTGSCCSGASSTYTMHVARSNAITGPYTGDRTFYPSTGNIHGPGHIGIYKCGSMERFTYHYYPASGGSVIGENTLAWGSDGWPVVGALATAGLKLPCSSDGIEQVSHEAEPVRVRRTVDGFELFVPQSAAGSQAEVLDLLGKTRGALRTVSGWNAIPGEMLVPGLSLVRVHTNGQISTAKIFDNR